MLKTYLGGFLLLLFLFAGSAKAQRFAQVGSTQFVGGEPLNTTPPGTILNWAGPIFNSATSATASRYAYIYTDSTLGTLTSGNLIRAIEFFARGANMPATGCQMKISIKSTNLRRFAADSLLWDTISASTAVVFNGNPAPIINGTAGLSTGAFVRFPFSTPVAPPTAARPNLLVLVEYSQATPQVGRLGFALFSSYTVTFGNTEVELARTRQAYSSVVFGTTPLSNVLKGRPVGVAPNPALNGLFKPTVRFIYTVLGSEMLASFTEPTEYTMKPISQGTMPVTLSYQLANAGSDTLRNVALRFEIKNSDSVVVHTVLTPAITKLAPGASATLSAPNWMPPVALNGYTVKYELVAAQSFASNFPRTFTRRFSLTSSTYARDNGRFLNGLGVGTSTGANATNNGQLGVVYEVTTSEQLNSITAFFSVSSLSDSTRLMVYRMGTGADFNTPNPAPVTQSSYYRFAQLTSTTAPSLQVTIPLANPFVLTPGRYLFSIEEPSGVNNVGIQYSKGPFTPNTTFLRLYAPAAPTGTWRPIETFDFGNDNQVNLMIRPNFTSTAQVQFINNTTTDSLAIADVFLNRVRTPIANDLRFRHATAFLPNVPAGRHWINVAPGTVPNPSRLIKGRSAGAIEFKEDSTYIVVLNGDTTDITLPGSFEVSVIEGDRRVAAAGNTNVTLHHGSYTALDVKVVEYGVNAATPATLVNNFPYGTFAKMGNLNTINGYKLAVVNVNEDTLGKFHADLLALGLGTRGITVLASGRVNQTPRFGLWAALPTGGALVELSRITSISKGATLITAVYPNPASDRLHIQLPANSTNTEIRLVNLQGALVHQSKVSTNQVELELGNLPAGMYILKLNSAQGQATHKIVKQ